ncbi:hypothetical protein G3N55_11320 [Dissulfurirhabdus thermomarina]|uniref:Lipoprotein n=1 Tax=Dissulfurirhabdus thermomarina TaxID=1765737 RepID=A0A6N9TQT4_DISTH|nr:hypothetical protein [Dissulfurirhabdus thermomarina]NDY43428.1 hypothetical protein [Dissulfurirhabdus thermomarina]NMX23575.1 hypothetical protein [Dissulfurirhabdus thermomarina]
MKKTPRFVPSFVLGLVLAVVFSLSGCAQKSVIVSKGSPEEREDYQGMTFLGSDRSCPVYRGLCGGDLREILAQSDLSLEQQEEFYQLVCGEKCSVKGCYEFFNALPDDARVSLIRAFEFYGYHVHGYG